LIEPYQSLNTRQVVAAAVGGEELWRCRKALYAADLLTPVGYIALGAHIDAALLAPSHAGAALL
jgi:hypothetical protein